MHFKTRLLAALFCMCALFISVDSFAQTFEVTKVADVDLGTAYAPATFSGSYFNSIGTNGTIQYASGYSGPATGIAGQVLIEGPVGITVQVSCTTDGSVRNSSGCCGQRNRNIDNFRFVIGASNVVGPGLGTACDGLGNSVVNHVITGVTANDTVYLGGRMQTTNVRIGGQYSSVGRTPITVRVRRFFPNTTINTDVEWYAAFESLVSIASTTNMQFGTINYTTMGVSERANLATNGNMTYAGTFSGGATGTAGRVAISGVENGVTLEVYCDTTATLSNGSGSSIQMTNIEADPEDSLGAIGTGNACAGTGGAAAMDFTYNSTSRNEIYFGGRLNGSTAASFAGGSHSTANAGGDNLEVLILNQ